MILVVSLVVICVVLIFGAFLTACGGFFVYMALREPEAWFAAVLLPVLGVVSVMIVGGRLMFWRRCTDEAEYVIIPVAYTRRIPKLNYRVQGNRYMAVFFLPSGKYRVALFAYQQPEQLHFIRWHGMVQMVN